MSSVDTALYAIDGSTMTAISTSTALIVGVGAATLNLVGKRGETRVSARAALVSGQQGYIAQITSDNAHLRAEQAELRGRIDRLEEENGEIPALRAEVRALRAENARVGDLRVELQEARRELTRLMGENTHLRARVTALEQAGGG